MTTVELIAWTKTRHEFYCDLADFFLATLDIEFHRPEFNLYAKNHGTAGYACYGKKVCDYNLVYLLSAEKNYEQIIAHEVAHFVVQSLEFYTNPHSNLFLFVLSKVFKMEGRKCHYHIRRPLMVEKAINIMKLINLKKETERNEDG